MAAGRAPSQAPSLPPSCTLDQDSQVPCRKAASGRPLVNLRQHVMSNKATPVRSEVVKIVCENVRPSRKKRCSKQLPGSLATGLASPRVRSLLLAGQSLQATSAVQSLARPALAANSTLQETTECVGLSDCSKSCATENAPRTESIGGGWMHSSSRLPTLRSPSPLSMILTLSTSVSSLSSGSENV